jgi:hypothetical protein
MNENFKWIVAGGILGVLAIGGYLYYSNREEAEPVTPPVVAAPKPAPVEPEVAHPLPEPEVQTPLPKLNESDAPARSALMELLGKEPVEQYIVPEELVRHIVVTIDNLPEPKVAERIRPLKRVPGEFVVSGTEEARVLDPVNYERYKPLVQLLKTTDTPTIVAAYMRYYPLLQEAYESLGHPPKYFNDRVIQVIDVMLAAPDLKGPIALAQPGVQFEYADPKLEALPAGQKVMIRMGSENAKAVKAKLRELRAALAK